MPSQTTSGVRQLPDLVDAGAAEGTGDGPAVAGGPDSLPGSSAIRRVTVDAGCESDQRSAMTPTSRATRTVRTARSRDVLLGDRRPKSTRPEIRPTTGAVMTLATTGGVTGPPTSPARRGRDDQAGRADSAEAASELPPRDEPGDRTMASGNETSASTPAPAIRTSRCGTDGRRRTAAGTGSARRVRAPRRRLRDSNRVTRAATLSSAASARPRTMLHWKVGCGREHERDLSRRPRRDPPALLPAVDDDRVERRPVDPRLPAPVLALGNAEHRAPLVLTSTSRLVDDQDRRGRRGRSWSGVGDDGSVSARARAETREAVTLVTRIR